MFNEEDPSVGMSLIVQFDKIIIEGFKEAFNGLEILSYTTYEMEFKVGHINYKLALSTKYDYWKVYRLAIS